MLNFKKDLFVFWRFMVREKTKMWGSCISSLIHKALQLIRGQSPLLSMDSAIETASIWIKTDRFLEDILDIMGLWGIQIRLCSLYYPYLYHPWTLIGLELYIHFFLVLWFGMNNYDGRLKLIDWPECVFFFFFATKYKLLRFCIHWKSLVCVYALLNGPCYCSRFPL